MGGKLASIMNDTSQFRKHSAQVGDKFRHLSHYLNFNSTKLPEITKMKLRDEIFTPRVNCVA